MTGVTGVTGGVVAGGDVAGGDVAAVVVGEVEDELLDDVPPWLGPGP